MIFETILPQQIYFLLSTSQAIKSVNMNFSFIYYLIEISYY